jgi:hypothetical protein
MLKAMLYFSNSTDWLPAMGDELERTAIFSYSNGPIGLLI